MTSPSAGDATGFSPSSSPDLGDSTAKDVKQQTNHPDLATSLDALLNRPTLVKSNLCAVGRVFLEVDSKTQDLLSRALSNESIAHIDIAKLLQANGFQMSHSTMGRHRNGECRCPK